MLSQVSATRMSDSFVERHTGEKVKISSKSTDVAKSPEKSKTKHSSRTKSSTKSDTQSTLSKAVVPPSKTVETPLFSDKNKNPQDKEQSEAAKVTVPSPRKTRSRVRRDSNAATTSAQVNGDLPKNSMEKSGRSKSRLCLKLPQLDGATDKPPSKKAREPTKKPRKNSESDSDSDFAPSPPKRVRPKSVSTHFPQGAKPKLKALENVKRADLRVLSTDDDDDSDAKTQKTTKITAMDTWIEAYNEKDKKWTVIDPVKNKVDAVEHIRVRNSKMEPIYIRIFYILFHVDIYFFYRNLHQNRSSTRLLGTTTIQFGMSHQDIAAIFTHPHENNEPIHCGWRWLCDVM